MKKINLNSNVSRWIRRLGGTTPVSVNIYGCHTYPYVLLTALVVLLFSSHLASTQEPPYPASAVIERVSWDWSTHRELAVGSDLWPVTWGADGHIYTSWGDGGGFGGTNSDGRVSLGFARLSGPPSGFTTANVWGGKNAEHPATFTGKAAGILSVGGVLYAWIAMPDEVWTETRLAWSSDLGATWQLSSWSFPQSTFAASTFLNFGKDYAGARDGFVYIYGGKRTGDGVHLARVPKDQLRDRAAYEFFAGREASGNPTWSADITKRQPVFSDPNSRNPYGAIQANVDYNAGLQRYMLTVSHGAAVKNLGIFDAPEPWGPWTTVAYYNDWGAPKFNYTGGNLLYYFPTKWMSLDGKTMWCIYSGYGPDSFNLVQATLTLKTAADTTASAPPASLTVKAP